MTESKKNIGRGEIAKTILHNHKKKYPHLSTTQISQDWGIPQSSLSRIENGQSTNLSFEQLLHIIVESGHGSKVFEYLKDSDPHFVELFKKQFSHNQEVSFISSPNIEFFANEDYEWIVNHAYTKTGISLDLIKEEFGNNGLNKVKELISAEIITQEGDLLKGFENRFKLPFNITLKRVRNFLKYYRLEEAGSVNNWLSLQTEKIAKEKFSDFKEILRKQFIERQDFLNNPVNAGDHLVYTSSVYSTFQSQNNGEKL